MLERPYITIRRLSRKNNNDTKKLVKYVFELSNKFSLWIIGISLASLSLIISSLNNIGTYITPSNLKVVFVSLFISVFCGIFYRVIFVFYYIYLESAFRIIDFALTDNEHMHTENTLTGNETIDEMIDLNSQFRNMQGVRELFDKADEPGKQQLYNNLVAWYVRDVGWAKRNLDATLSNIADIYHAHLGLSRKKFFREPSIFLLNFTKYTSIILYFGFMLSFLFAFAYFLLTINIHQ